MGCRLGIWVVLNNENQPGNFHGRWRTQTRVGAGLPAMTAALALPLNLTHRHRQQAGSYSFLDKTNTAYPHKTFGSEPARDGGSFSDISAD